jgi:branched-chain amino acid transport system ATP-binding protein
MLELENVQAGYGLLKVLHGVDLTVNEGEITALLGSNGAGKTTTTRAIGGLIPTMGGEIRYRGDRIDDDPPHEIVSRGIVQVPEERNLFTGMSVWENLYLGAQRRGAKEKRAENIDQVMELFPRLRERKEQEASTMSGGEQQMLTVGRALMNEPELLILDEPSIGLAPQLVTEVFEVIEEIHTDEMGILIIEQNVEQTLRLADKGYVMEQGKITLEGTGEELLSDDEVQKAYLGV